MIVGASAAVPAMAMQGNDMKSDDKMDHGTDGMQMDQSGMGGTFKHHDSMDGMNADFQVMRLATMNMTSDKGETHHIMVDLSEADGGAPIKNAVGKIKVIGLDKTEQVSTLKN